MKKYFIIIIILIFAISAQAQFKLGVRGGVNFSFQETENSSFDIETMGMQQGFVAAFIYEKTVFSFLSIQPQLVYSQRGVLYKTQISYNSLAIDYLEFHPSIKLYVPIFPLYLIVAPYAAYSFTASSQIDDEPYISETIGPDNILSYDFGITGGLGYLKTIRSVSIYVEARYEYGFMDINGQQNSNGLEIANFNRNLTASLGFLYHLRQFRPD